MARGATGFTKRHAGTEAIVAGAALRSMEDDAPRAVPLELSPLIAPYRKHGRLSLRVERLPHRARLSRGHNNGDRSWSLMSDELDGLAYLPPKGAAESCVLGIRIVSLDGGDGGTLALLDYPVATAEEGTAPAAAEKSAPARDTAELRCLRDELAKAKEALAAHERAAEEKLAASSKLASEMLERGRAGDRDELRRLRDELAETKEALAAGTRRAAEMLARDQVDAKADKDWRAGEAARLAAAEARGEAKAAKALAEAQAQLERFKTRATAESARERGDEQERRRLRDEVVRLKKSLGLRDEELAEARALFQRDGEAALKKAEITWREQGERQLSVARAQWQERSDRALAEARSQFERAQTRAESETAQRLRDLEVELERALDDLTIANEAIADRENDIAELQAGLDDQRRETETLRGSESEIRKLRGEIDALRIQVAERDRDIVQAREALEQAEQDWRAEAETKLATAQAEWRKSETARVQAAEARAEESAQAVQSRLAQRVKQLESELQQARNYAEALSKRGDSDDIKQLRRDFGHLQARLSERDTEIAQLRLDSEHARERWTAEARMSLQRAEHEWHEEAEAAEREERRTLGRQRTIRDVVLVGALSAVAVLFYFGGFASVLPEPLAGWIAPPAQLATAQQTAPHPATANAAPKPKVTVIRSANLRSAPSKSASVIATLPRNAELQSVDRQGNWVKVEGAGKEGWVYASFLKTGSKAGPKTGS